VFNVGDKIVHPMHGAGIVSEIQEQRINGINRQYYVLRIPSGDMCVMIPTHNSQEIGVRAVIDASTAEDLIFAMQGIEIDMTNNWNRRYRENMLRIKSGDLIEVAKVVKGLMERESQNGLSTGERKMLSSAKHILISELVLAQSSCYETIEKRITEALVG
jgi:CarD family transcriptional regulator